MSSHERSLEGLEPVRSAEQEHSCIFCGIIKGEVAGSIVSTTENTTTFLSLEGHPLIAPNKHYTNMFDENFDETTAAELGIQMVKTVKAVKDVYGVEDCNVFVANGANAGQEIPHAHIHIIPRIAGDKKISARRQPFQSRDALNARATQLSLRLQQAQE